MACFTDEGTGALKGEVAYTHPPPPPLLFLGTELGNGRARTGTQACQGSPRLSRGMGYRYRGSPSELSEGNIRLNTGKT